MSLILAMPSWAAPDYRENSPPRKAGQITKLVGTRAS
jgi:hypothetical protein